MDLRHHPFLRFPGGSFQTWQARVSVPRDRWVLSLPQAKRVGECVCDSRKIQVWRVEGIDVPCSKYPDGHGIPFEGAVPPEPGLFAARTEPGYPRWFVRVKLWPEQLSKFGFTVERHDV